MENKTAIIMRGVPGSGKSTEAEKIVMSKNGVIHSTDNYHTLNGEYIFDINKLHHYHQMNLAAFKESIDKGIETVICDNTNIHKKEYMPYVLYAREKGYKVHMITFKPMDIQTHLERNVHDVPEEIIDKMIKGLSSNMYDDSEADSFVGIGFNLEDIDKSK